MSKQIKIVTGNPNKVREIKEIMTDINIDIGIIKIDLMEMQGKPLEVIKHKAATAIKQANCPIVVEDVSFNLKCLGELPGPYIKYFVESVHAEGLYKMAIGFNDFRAQAILSIGMTRFDGDEIVVLQAVVDGKVVEPRGQNGFGFDSCFVPDGYDKTYAELTAEEKNKVSHRGKGYRMLQEYIQTHPEYLQ
ncbi:Inosine triphosphate pyrophosphatase [Entamoeba marina]